MSYLRPAEVRISDSWQGHRDRRPTSQEPGTDYATARGTDLVIPADGRISVVDNTTTGAAGRRVSFDLDDGRRISWIHLGPLTVRVGQRVTQGQTGIIRSGASAWGSENGVGAHVHVSLWARPGMPWRDTIDFERHIRQPETEEEDAMIINIRGKGGVRRGGLYFVSGGRATFIGARGKGSAFPRFTNEAEIARLQSRITGLR